MFSGIVEKTGVIKEFVSDKLVIQEPSITKELNVSDSIAVNGICLTIVDKNIESLDNIREDQYRSSLKKFLSIDVIIPF